jgi:hypothetical protein
MSQAKLSLSQTPSMAAFVRAAYVRSVVAALSQNGTQASILMQEALAVVLEVREGGRIFRLNEPIYLTRFAENGYIYLRNRSLSILSYGTSEQDAVVSFREDFGALWDCIAKADDATLTPDAIEVKQRLLAIVNTVVPE